MKSNNIINKTTKNITLDIILENREILLFLHLHNHNFFDVKLNIIINIR